MLVEFAGGIEAASGTLCKNRNGSRVIVTTRKAATTSNKGKIRMYIRPASCYQRRTPYSDAELAAQELFTKRQAYVTELIQLGCSKSEAWQIAKRDIPN